MIQSFIFQEKQDLTPDLTVDFSFKSKFSVLNLVSKYLTATFFLLWFLFSGIELNAYTYTRPSRTTLIADLMAKNPNFDHPRLYARSSDFALLKQYIISDQLMSSWYAKMLAVANRYVDIDTVPTNYRETNLTIIQNGYLNTNTRYFPEKMCQLALCYQITGQQKYADRAYKEMMALDSIPDWTSTKYGYHLMTADILWGFAVAYDWCYAAYSPTQKAVLKSNMLNKGINKLLAMYNANPTYKIPNIGNPFSDGNHNPWDNGGASVAAMAIGDEEPTVSGELLERALVVAENFTIGYGTFGCTEGPGYGDTALNRYMEWMAALESALGSSYNYINAPGITDLAYFHPYVNGPIKSLNYHDAGTDALGYLQTTFFVANKTLNPALGNMHKNDLIAGRTSPVVKDLFWFKPENYGSSTEVLPLDRYFGGNVQTGSMRTSFSDDNALFLAFHGGENNVGHRHLDTGQFNIDAMGLNWALDLGTEPLTYDAALRSKYKSAEFLYRINPGGHNTLLIDPDSVSFGQSSSAYSPVTKFVSQPTGAFAIMDMSKAYQTQVNSAVRGYALTANRSKFVIQDEIDLIQPSVVWWNMHTRAVITVSADGKTAILSQSGKRMRASLVSPAGASFLSMKAEPLPEMYQNAYQTTNGGIQKLAIKLSGVKNTTIRVEIIPVLTDADLSVATLPLIPLSKWAEPQMTTGLPPSIFYSASSLVTASNVAITPLTPINTGGAVPASVYGTVSTAVAAAGGQPHGMAFNADYSILYTGLKNTYRLGAVTMLTGLSATLAGTGAIGTLDGTGIAASFAAPYGVAVHPISGDIYVADQTNNKIRKVTPLGVVTTFAGTGTLGSTDGAISTATFNLPCGLIFDTDGTLYVLQSGNSAIRKIDAASATVSTIASSIGSATYHFAYFNGYFYVTEVSGNKIDKVSLIDGSKTVFAGSGTVGSADGIGTAATFNGPRGIVLDATGNVYVADYTNNKIRKITPSGEVTTLAGSGLNATTNGVGVSAAFKSPAGLCLDNKGNLYVGDAGGSNIRKISVSGYSISPNLPAGLSFDGTTGIISGTPTSTAAATDYTITASNGSGTNAAIVNLSVLSVLPPNISYSTPNVYLINKPITAFSPVNSGGLVTSTTGTYSISPALPAGLSFNTSTGTISGTPTVLSALTKYTVTVTNNGGQNQATFNFRISAVLPPVFAYSGNSFSYKINEAIIALAPVNNGGAVPATIYGTVSTVAGLGGQAQGLAFNKNKTVLYTPLSNTNQLKLISLPTTVSILAGSGLTTPFADGVGTAASFNGLFGVAVHPITGDIYVADINNNKIRKITTAGVVSTFAGTGVAGSMNGAIATATFSAPRSLVFDDEGNLYVLHPAYPAIRKIDALGTTVSTVCSLTNGTNPYCFSFSNGYFYVSEATGGKINKINLADGSISVLAGSGTAGAVDGPGTSASFYGPRGIVVDNSGNVYVADYSNNKIRKISAEGLVTTIAGSGTNATTDGVGLSAAFRSPAGLCLDDLGNLYVGDAGGSNIRKVAVSGYTISPTLPAGLSFDGKTGKISGVPTAVSPATPYTISAFNSDGSCSTSLTIKVDEAVVTEIKNESSIIPLNVSLKGNNEICINGEVGINALATLFDVQGKTVLVEHLNNGNLNFIPVSNLEKGVYILVVKVNGCTQRMKIVLSK